MKLVFLYGPPAVGKLTVARELAALTGYKLFHNHLVVDALTAVFDFGSDAFIVLRERFWIDVMSAAAATGVDGLIFTFAPERTVTAAFVDRLRDAVEGQGGELVFARLECAEDVLEGRLNDESRRSTGKLTSTALYRQLKAAGTFEVPMIPDPSLTVDTGVETPIAAARAIARHIAPDPLSPGSRP